MNTTYGLPEVSEHGKRAIENKNSEAIYAGAMYRISQICCQFPDSNLRKMILSELTRTQNLIDEAKL